jgi:proteasome beta subunit
MEKELEKLSKKGTTTVGVVTKGGIVLAADRRAAMNYLVAHRRMLKIFPITDRIVMTIAGLVGDCQMLIRYLQAEMRLYEIRKLKKPTVKAAATLLSHILFSNRMSPFPFYAQLLMGGYDETGYHLFTLVPDGSCVEDKYIATGSGSPIAYGLLEDAYKEEIELKDGVRLVVRAVNAALKRDVWTGDGIDVVVITKAGVKRYSEEEIKKIIAR